MTSDQERSHLDRARELRRVEAFVDAGDHFTTNAYNRFGRSTPHVTWWGVGLVNMQRAAICYRIGNRMDRCENRCRQGILIAEDVIDHVFEEEPDYYWDRARRGCWYEHIGDLRVIGQLGGAASAYDTAREIYRADGDPDTFLAEEEHGPLMELFRSIAGGVDQDPGPIDSNENDLTFTDWVTYKQEHLPGLLAELEAQGEWPIE